MFKYFVITFFLAQVLLIGLGQSSNCVAIYDLVDKMPVYGKDGSELYDFLGKNVQLSEQCRPTGKLHFSFIIDKNGNAVEIDVKGLPDSCKNDLLKQLARMNKWTPGYLDGKAVCVRFIVLVNICYR